MKNLNEFEMNIVSGAGVNSADYDIETYPIDLDINDQYNTNQPVDLIFDVELVPSETGTSLDISINDPKCICWLL